MVFVQSSWFFTKEVLKTLVHVKRKCIESGKSALPKDLILKSHETEPGESQRSQSLGPVSNVPSVCVNCRICGNEASSKNIHGTVSEQLKKNFAKSRWKVSSNPLEHVASNRVFVFLFFCVYMLLWPPCATHLHATRGCYRHRRVCRPGSDPRNVSLLSHGCSKPTTRRRSYARCRGSPWATTAPAPQPQRQWRRRGRRQHQSSSRLPTAPHQVRPAAQAERARTTGTTEAAAPQAAPPATQGLPRHVGGLPDELVRALVAPATTTPPAVPPAASAPLADQFAAGWGPLPEALGERAGAAQARPDATQAPPLEAGQRLSRAAPSARSLPVLEPAPSLLYLYPMYTIPNLCTLLQVYIYTEVSHISTAYILHISYTQDPWAGLRVYT